MKDLASAILSLRGSKIRKMVASRIQKLKQNFSSEKKVFSELCFCLLTANERATKAIEIQEKIGDGFLKLPKEKLVLFLKNHKYRFYNSRANYIIEARKHYGKLRKTFSKLETDNAKREWLVENVLGFGYKEASHFLLNLGFYSLAILDKHIINIMYKHGLIAELPKRLGKKTYLEYEAKLGTLCKKLGVSQGELDFYLWYMETGKILK
ncbi:MAG: N-glycosylase/DNA lyase [Candidatus Paceibacteria bacterium]